MLRMRILALVALVACGHATVDLSAKAQLVDARLADVRAASDRRDALLREGPATDPTREHDLRVEREGAENRLLRARERYNEAAADYDATLARADGPVIDRTTGKRYEPRPYLPTTEHAPFVAPALRGRVNDLAGKLTDAQRQALEADLAAFDRATTNEVVVLILPSLEGRTIEDVAYTTANTWKLGKRDKDNGVLVVIAVADRRVRIETGRGLGAVLTDLRTSEIIDAMKPALREGDFAGALRTAVEAIEKTLRPN